MSKNIKKIVSMVAAFAIIAAMGLGAYAYFTDYATQSMTTYAGTFDIALNHSIDLDGEINIINPGDVAAFDFTVTNMAEKSADIYAVVTVTATGKDGLTPGTASPYKLLVDGSTVNFEDKAEVGSFGTNVGSVKKDGSYKYIYTLPVNTLSGSIEKDGAADAYTYQYELGMDIDALNEWEGSKVDVSIEIFAKQHRNTDAVTTDLARWETAVRAEIESTDPVDVQTK